VLHGLLFRSSDSLVIDILIVGQNVIIEECSHLEASIAKPRLAFDIVVKLAHSYRFPMQVECLLMFCKGLFSLGILQHAVPHHIW
jgi:hypothetical protein